MRLLKICAATATLLVATGLFALDNTGYTPYQDTDNASKTPATTNNMVMPSNSSDTMMMTSGQTYYQPYNAGAMDMSATSNACCPTKPEEPCDQEVGDCWCKYVHWQPCPYTTSRCVEEQIPCEKQCCRMVPKYYQVQQCRMVPQNYNVTVCRMEPEYYTVPDCKTCTKVVCDQHCKYVPQYYWKRVCNGSNNVQCPAGY